MPEETGGLPVAKAREGEKLVVLLGLCLAEDLDERCLKDEVFAFGWRRQDEGLDLTCGDVVEGRHDVVKLSEVSHYRRLASGELGLDHTQRAWAGAPEGLGQWPGHPQRRETCLAYW